MGLTIPVQEMLTVRQFWVKQPIEVREHLSVARWFPNQLRSQRIAFKAHKNQSVLPGKMPRRCFPDLIYGRKMNETIADIHSRSPINAIMLGQNPVLDLQYLENSQL